MMVGLARKVLIFAAIDGLIVQPQGTNGQRPQKPARIKYGASTVASRSKPADGSPPQASFEAFGIVGLMTVSKSTYLISVVRRRQVAQICGAPIYVVTEVAITPCASQKEAEDSISHTSLRLQKYRLESDLSEAPESPGTTQDSALEEVEDAIHTDDDDDLQNETKVSDSGNSSVAKDVITRRGSYGRFAQKWFSKTGWMQDQKRSLGWANAVAEARPSPEPTSSGSTPHRRLSDSEDTAGSMGASLLPKLLRTTSMLFGSQCFFYSYDFDITRSWTRREDVVTDELPLHRRVDPQFFWNRNLLSPFMDASEDSLALPMIQGFVGQASFVVDSEPPQIDDEIGASAESVELHPIKSQDSVTSDPQQEVPGSRPSPSLRSTEKEFLLTLISRRSVKRAGLRYLRRGIDEDGNTANTVETEQILSTPSWDTTTPIYSFLQFRGSIPLFFTQTPYSLKPVPILQHSPQANYTALKKHFDRLRSRYGSIQIVNLVEKHGNEAIVGKPFQEAIVKLQEETSGEKNPISFEWFDFHAACRGMKFENVSQLLEKLRGTLDEFSSTVDEKGQQMRYQKGILRTNCMDCLDRTNVCQSSFAKYMLDDQLKALGYDLSVQIDQETTWFNTVWADNGDAVSKQYASTAAMKGDYTRTRRRDYRGTLNDLGLSLTRFYNGMVNDYFSQAVINFLLGNVTSMVFAEFEAEMNSPDLTVSLTKMREQAIELCQRRVIEDEGEEFSSGWVMLSPANPDTKLAPLEEVVLLLTDAALYLCRIDWNLDKVSSFERVDLAHITHIKFGTYITSTISPVHTDDTTNVGLAVTYQPGKNDITRLNTRTLTNLIDDAPKPDGTKDKDPISGLAALLTPKPRPPPAREMVFKSPYAISSTTVGADDATGRQTEIQQVVTIAAEIERLVFNRAPSPAAAEGKSIIEKGDVVSLEDARRSTGILDQLGHTIKKLVWA